MALMLALTYRKVSTKVGKKIEIGQFDIEDLAGGIVGGNEKLRLIQVNYELKPGLARL